MIQRAQDMQETLVALRREVHRHPELGFQEHNTARLVAERLAELGIAARTGVAKTGVVGDLGESGPRIALRADMDALPIQEEILAEEAAAGRLPGQVRFLFQPSEEDQDDEGLSGGMRMADEGVMEGVDAVVALHVSSDVPLGNIEVREGANSAFVDTFELAVLGREAHGAFPHQGFDAITLSAQVIQAMQTVVSRRLDPIRGRVLTVGTIQGGTKDNIVAGRVTMTGTIRTFEPETREALLAELERACGVARALGGDYELRIVPGYAAIVNDPDMAALVREVASDLLGPEHVQDAELQMGGEDFAYFAQKAPGCFFSLGGAIADEPPRRHHHPLFDIDEACLPIGAALLAEIAVRFLREASDP